ncbi:MAG: GNAT family N-acetyltransferase [Acidimicrobiales bacterium]
MPMQSPAWIEACRQSFTSWRHELIGVRRGDQLAAAALLSSRHRGPLRRLTSVSEAELGEPASLASMDRAAGAELARALTRLRSPIRLGRVPALWPVAEGFAARGGRWVRLRPAPGLPWIPLDAGWADPAAHLTAGRRSDLRRAERRAATMGKVSRGVLAPGPGETARLLDELEAVELSGWKGRQSTAIGQRPELSGFLRRYAQNTAEQGALRVGALRIDGRAVAMHLAVVMSKRWWVLKIAYDEGLARCSPGTLLLVDCLAGAAAEGIGRFELLGAPEEWMAPWGAQVTECTGIKTYPRSPGGLVAALADLSHAAGLRQ